MPPELAPAPEELYEQFEARNFDNERENALEDEPQPEVDSEEELDEAQIGERMLKAAQDYLGGDAEAWSMGEMFQTAMFRDGELFDLKNESITQKIEEAGFGDDHRLMLAHFEGQPGEAYLLPDYVTETDTEVTYHVPVSLVDSMGRSWSSEARYVVSKEAIVDVPAVEPVGDTDSAGAVSVEASSPAVDVEESREVPRGEIKSEAAQVESGVDVPVVSIENADDIPLESLVTDSAPAPASERTVSVEAVYEPAEVTEEKQEERTPVEVLVEAPAEAAAETVVSVAPVAREVVATVAQETTRMPAETEEKAQTIEQAPASHVETPSAITETIVVRSQAEVQEAIPEEIANVNVVSTVQERPISIREPEFSATEAVLQESEEAVSPVREAVQDAHKPAVAEETHTRPIEQDLIPMVPNGNEEQRPVHEVKAAEPVGVLAEQEQIRNSLVELFNEDVLSPAKREQEARREVVETPTEEPRRERSAPAISPEVAFYMGRSRPIHSSAIVSADNEPRPDTEHRLDRGGIRMRRPLAA